MTFVQMNSDVCLNRAVSFLGVLQQSNDLIETVVQPSKWLNSDFNV